jgi:cysteine desulfurase
MEVVYLDHAATTPLSAEVREAMEPLLGPEFGNPSARHPAGVRAAEALDRARGALARALGGRPETVTFTSGGTEANNLAVLGLARATARRGTSRGHVLVGPTEHPSVREPARALAEEGFEVETLRLRDDGALDLDHAAERLRDDTLLVAQVLVQNEVGTVYPVARLARLVRARSPRARLHVDAVQACGKLDVSLEELDADTLAVSAHKLGGPQGAGALLARPGVSLRPLILGGGQEAGLRSGTQNVAGAVGLACAVERGEARREVTLEHLARLRARLVDGLDRLPGAHVLAPGGADDGLAPWIVAVRFEGAPAEVRMHHLEARGLYVSAGSACQASKRELSPTYAALGLTPEEARGVLRLSLGAETTTAQVEAALRALAEVSAELDGMRVERSAS